MARQGMEYILPCESCVSPGRTPILDHRLSRSLSVFRRASGQVIVVGGGLVPVVPIDINLSAVESLMRIMGVSEEHWLETIDDVRELFHLTNDEKILDRATIERDAREAGVQGPLVLEV